VQIDPQSLRRHYESLSDDELIVIDRAELTELARKCFDAEYARRELMLAEGPAAPENDAAPLEPQGDGMGSQDEFDAAEEPDWLEEAACACSYRMTRGRSSSSASDADNAREVLQAAGIPCRIETNDIDPPPEEPQPYSEYRVMVPGALNLQAASVLDKEIFNSELEAEWRTHLAALSDQELRALNPNVICAGLRDRIERLTRAYNDEIARRRESLN
jgi:hypothetical protein